MKLRYSDYSITHKITAVFMLTAGAGLLLAYLLAQSLSLAARVSETLVEVAAKNAEVILPGGLKAHWAGPSN